MRTYLFLFIALLINLNIFSQGEWYKHFTSPDNITLTYSAQDLDGNWVIVGVFRQTMDADPGMNEAILTSEGIDDIFLIKLNPQGEYLWSKSYGGTWQDFPTRVKIDNEGNIVIVGFFYDTIDLNPDGEPVIFSTYLGGGGQSESFFLKLTPAGDYIKAFHFRGLSNSSNGKLISLAFDSDNNAILIGEFEGNIDIDPTENNTILTSQTNTHQDIYILKLSTADTLMWGFNLGGDQSDTPQDVVLDELDNIYITGQYRLGMDFDPGPDTLYIPTVGDDSNDIFIIALNPDGELIWGKGIGGPSAQWGRKILYKENDGLYVVGTIRDTVNFRPDAEPEIILTSNGSEDVFLMKLATNGEVQWAKSWGGASNEAIYSLEMSNDGNIICAGEFRETIDFDPGNEILNKSSNGGIDLFVSSFSPNGDFLNVLTRGGSGDDRARFAILENGYYTIVGSTNNSVNLNPPLEDAQISASNARHKLFFARFIPTELTQIEEFPSDYISIFPNPSNGIVNIQTENNEPIASLKLIDISGRTIGLWDNIITNQIDLTSYPSGIYFLSIKMNQDEILKKLVIF